MKTIALKRLAESHHEKKVIRTKFALFLVAMILSSAIFSQTKKQAKKIDKKEVPVEILTTYNVQYPDAILDGLYDTPYYDWNYDYYPDWYGDWYDSNYWGYYPYNDVVEYEYTSPENYEIDFTKNSMKSRSLYGPNGKWIETRTEVKQLPIAISDAVKKTEYGKGDKWKMAKHTEKIESPNFTGAHYRMAYKDGSKSHILTFDENGKMVMTKKMGKKV